MNATKFVYGAKILVEDGAEVKANETLLEWDPYTFSILTEVSGTIHFKDIVDNITCREEVDEVTGLSQWVITDSPDEKRLPTIIVKAETGHKSDDKRYLMPTHAHLSVKDGDTVHAGDVLAKILRATTRTKDITGGLPRVVELFEARKPHEPAVMSEIDGVVPHRRRRQRVPEVHRCRRRWSRRKSTRFLAAFTSPYRTANG